MEAVTPTVNPSNRPALLQTNDSTPFVHKNLFYKQQHISIGKQIHFPALQQLIFRPLLLPFLNPRDGASARFRAPYTSLRAAVTSFHPPPHPLLGLLFPPFPRALGGSTSQLGPRRPAVACEAGPRSRICSRNPEFSSGLNCPQGRLFFTVLFPCLLLQSPSRCPLCSEP